MTKIVLMGDSITEYLPYILDSNKERKKGFNQPVFFEKSPKLSGIFYTCGVENIGIGNFHKYCWPRVDKENVDCFIVLLGINNICRPDCDYDERETLDDVYEKMRAFITDIKNDGYDVMVQSIYPTDREKVNVKVKYVNERLYKYCKENSIEYIDLYDKLLNEQQIMNPKYSDDGLHPNKLGYGIILKEICEKINLKSRKQEPIDLDER